MNTAHVIVSFGDLCKLCATDQEDDVVTWLRVNDIAFFLDANDQPCTTASALDEAVHRGKRTSSSVVDHDELKAITGLSQTGAMRKHLNKAGIRCKYVNGRLFTTNQAITDSINGRARKRPGLNFDALGKGPNLAALDKPRN